jgi:glycosyltransferase involved in cell wall biosynthesis
MNHGIALNHRILYTPHGFSLESLNFFSSLFYKIIEMYLYRYTDVLIHVSETERELFLKSIPNANKDKHIYIPNGIELIPDEYYISKAEVFNYILPNKIEDRNAKNILFIGRISAQKGLDILINAIDMLDRADFNLYIIGEGEENYENYIKKLVDQSKHADKIFWLGKIRRAKYYMKAFDGIVIPSRYEGMPYILLEAMIAQMPIITTPSRGITDLVDSSTSFMSDFISAESLKKSLNVFLDAPNNYLNKITNINYKKVEKDYSEKNVMRKIGKLYLDLIQ